MYGMEDPKPSRCNGWALTPSLDTLYLNYLPEFPKV